MIIDTGPMVLLIAETQSKGYEACKRVFESFRGNLVTTLPCVTEAMYLVGDWHFQSRILDWVKNRSILILGLDELDLGRIRVLMEKYQDTPMDFADASLVVAAEVLKTNQIFTLDTDFNIYRIKDSAKFEIVP
jgi:predicted nucleic acid-binding protein